MFVIITMKGKTKFARSHISTGFIEFVLGKEVDVDKYMDARTIMLVILMVYIKSYFESSDM